MSYLEYIEFYACVTSTLFNIVNFNVILSQYVNPTGDSSLRAKYQQAE